MYTHIYTCVYDVYVHIHHIHVHHIHTYIHICVHHIDICTYTCFFFIHILSKWHEINEGKIFIVTISSTDWLKVLNHTYQQIIRELLLRNHNVTGPYQSLTRLSGSSSSSRTCLDSTLIKVKTREPLRNQQKYRKWIERQVIVHYLFLYFEFTVVKGDELSEIFIYTLGIPALERIEIPYFLCDLCCLSFPYWLGGCTRQLRWTFHISPRLMKCGKVVKGRGKFGGSTQWNFSRQRDSTQRDKDRNEGEEWSGTQKWVCF